MTGTRFAVFPQANEGWLAPDVITVSPRAGTVGPGPADATLRAILPVWKRRPYDPPSYMPPYTGPCQPPALPDAKGNFDHVAVSDPAFLPAHIYACVRHTLDVWEGYLRHPVVWWHAAEYPQMELSALTDWDNAHSGMGFIEAGHRRNRAGVDQLFCLNFDIMAHETGHTILFSQIGAPAPDALTGQFFAFHESFSDMVALIAALHFPTVRTRLLQQTEGDLYALNLLNRVGELSDSEQIRIADNVDVMQDVDGLRLGPDGEWVDPLGLSRNAHAVAQPLTGAVFDMLVEVFQHRLVALGALPPTLDARGWARDDVQASLTRLNEVSARSLDTYFQPFDAALCHARDAIGRCMAAVMLQVPADGLSFSRVAGVMLQQAVADGHGALLPDFVDIFRERGIEPRAMHTGLVRGSDWALLSYAEKRRRVVHALRPRSKCGCHPARMVFANRLVRHPERSKAHQPRAKLLAL